MNIEGGPVVLQPTNKAKKQRTVDELLALLKENKIIKDFSIDDENIKISTESAEVKL